MSRYVVQSNQGEIICGPVNSRDVAEREKARLDQEVTSLPALPLHDTFVPAGSSSPVPHNPPLERPPIPTFEVVSLPEELTE